MEFKSDALEFGTAIHLVLAEYYYARMTGDRMPIKEVHRLFEDRWRTMAEDNDEIRYSVGKDFKTLLSSGTDLLTAWHERMPKDNYRILSIEEPFSFDIPGLPIPVIGVTDLIEEDESGTIIITDWKTSARSYGIDEVDRNQQLTCYQMAAKANGFSDRQIILKFDTLIKTQKPKFEQYYSTRSDIDERRLVRKIHKVWEGISRGVFIPNDTSWKCPSCQYRQHCDEWFLKGGEL
jgi:putative RecB family exonuclease